MSHVLRCSLLALAIACGFFSTPGLAESPTGAAAVDAAWRAAMLANDLDAVMANYAADAVMWLPGAPEARGQEAIRKSYADMLGANTVTAAEFANAHYETTGTMSVGWGDFNLQLTPRAGGTPAVLSGRFTVLAKKLGAKWVYVVDHASGNPAPSAP